MRDAPTTHGKNGDAHNDFDRDWGGASDEITPLDRVLIGAVVFFGAAAMTIGLTIF